MNTPRDRHIAFSISAGCYFYQLGIAYYIQKHFNLTGIKFSGASGGGWPAVLLAAGIDVKEGFECVVKYAPQCCQNRPILGAYMVYDKGISIVFERLFRDLALPDMVNGKLGLSVTRLAWNGLLPYLKDELVTEFFSNDDIRQCIIASALIPYALNGKPYVVYRGWICADGGITNVTGVRHFAEELVHDIEMIEEQVVEQAHQLSDHLITGHYTPDTPQHPHDVAPMSIGPYGIVRFGATITNALVIILSESMQRLMERRRAGVQLTSHEGIDHTDSVPSSLDSCEVNRSLWRRLCQQLTPTESKSVNPSPSLTSSPCDPINRSHSTEKRHDTKASTACGILQDLVSTVSSAFRFDDADASMQSLCDSQASWPDSLCADLSEGSGSVSECGGLSVLRVDSHEEDECVEFSFNSTRQTCGICSTTCEEEEQDGWDGDESYGMGSVSSTTGSSTASIDEECRQDNGKHSDPKSSNADKQPSTNGHTRFSSPLIPRDNLIDDDHTYWRVKGQLISKIPNGGVQLEISPWMWRHHSILNYHLSADPSHARKLFEMGIIDACEHHWDLLQFFDPDEYTSMLREL